jgi:hypothetical protein
MAAKKESSGGVVLVDHNTGNSHPFASAAAAEEAYKKINGKDAARGFGPNYSIMDADGTKIGGSGIAA